MASWQQRARAAARAAFFARRPGGVLARLVHDSVVDTGAPLEDHVLTFEHDGVTIRVHVLASDTGAEVSCRIEPAGGRVAVLHLSGAGPPVASVDAGEDRFTFPALGHGMVRLRVESPGRPVVWTDWFRV